MCVDPRKYLTFFAPTKTKFIPFVTLQREGHLTNYLTEYYLSIPYHPGSDTPLVDMTVLSHEPDTIGDSDLSLLLLIAFVGVVIISLLCVNILTIGIFDLMRR